MRESNLTNFCTNKLFRWLHGKLWATDGADESGTKAHIHRVGLAPIYLSNHWQTSTYTQNTTYTNGKHEKRLNVFIRQRSNDNSTLSTHIAAHHHIKNIRTHTWTGWNSLLALKGWSSNLSETNGWSEKVFRHFRKHTHFHIVFNFQMAGANYKKKDYVKIFVLMSLAAEKAENLPARTKNAQFCIKATSRFQWVYIVHFVSILFGPERGRNKATQEHNTHSFSWKKSESFLTSSECAVCAGVDLIDYSIVCKNKNVLLLCACFINGKLDDGVGRGAAELLRTKSEIFASLFFSTISVRWVNIPRVVSVKKSVSLFTAKQSSAKCELFSVGFYSRCWKDFSRFSLLFEFSCSFSRVHTSLSAAFNIPW